MWCFDASLKSGPTLTASHAPGIPFCPGCPFSPCDPLSPGDPFSPSVKTKSNLHWHSGHPFPSICDFWFSPFHHLLTLIYRERKLKLVMWVI